MHMEYQEIYIMDQEIAGQVGPIYTTDQICWYTTMQKNHIIIQWAAALPAAGLKSYGNPDHYAL